ncbi:NAD(P)-binding domain-containing protein [Saccharopolyspora sp. K220]|uniref:NAD(P)-binding domain-containing protein n=1 Tax=Saccharopolyspora soli TaxID=2926618 RepID=UPI001F5A2B7C|nr:NAD(P)-binding domain-containing protein [Saccharopolyspora soli]MCI2415801.1 NAD(P)-binding domain-containing protein [Saccharopolyspora soli]
MQRSSPGTGEIGAAIVRLLAERGSEVAVTCRSNERKAAELTGEVERHCAAAGCGSISATRQRRRP